MPEPTWKVSSQQDFSKLRAAALDRSTKKQNNRVGLEEDIARNDNESGAGQPTPLTEGLDTDTNTAYPLAFFQFPFVHLPSATYSPASGDRMDLLSAYCRRQEGVNMDDSHLPHPTMLEQAARIQRTDFEALMHGFMKDDGTHNTHKEACNIDCNDVIH